MKHFTKNNGDRCTFRNAFAFAFAFFFSFALQAQTPPAPAPDNIDYGNSKTILQWKNNGWQPERVGRTQLNSDRTACLGDAINPVYISATYPISTAELTAGAFPAGVTGVLAGSIYTISGTPTASGTFNYTVTVTGAAGKSGSVSGKITVENCITIPDPETLPNGAVGAGTLVGRTCFDVVANTSESVSPAAREIGSMPTDFTDRSGVTTSFPYSGVQNYTFTANAGTISKVRYVIDDPAGVIDQTTTSANTPLSGILEAGDLASGNSVNLTVYYKSDLNTNHALVNAGREGAAKATITIIYYDGTQDVKTPPLTVSIQDCACCGAGSTDGFLVFMCYNLGARSDMSIAAQVAYTSLRYNNVAASSTYADDAANVHGDLYQWGRNKEDGHHVRSSQSYPTNNITAESGVIGSADLDGNGQVTLAGAIGKFVKNNASETYRDWRTPQLPTLWDDNSGLGTTRIKTANDPCPQGWRVPTRGEWASVADEAFNDRTATGTFANSGSAAGTPGWLFKPRNGAATSVTTANATLFLPVAGGRNNSTSALSVGSDGGYWSSTVTSTIAYYFYIHSGTVGAANTIYRAYGLSVRCVAE